MFVESRGGFWQTFMKDPKCRVYLAISTRNSFLLVDFLAALKSD